MENDKIEFDYQGTKVWCSKEEWDCNNDFYLMLRGLMSRKDFESKWPQDPSAIKIK